MPIDRRRLRELSAEVDQLHHESMRTARQDLAEVHFGEVADELRPGRRRFLAQAAAGSALTLGATVLPVGRFLPAAWGAEEPSDADLAAFAAGLELAAVAAYNTAAGTGKLSGPASAVGTMFAGHHQDHADALNDILGEEAAVEKANPAVLKEFGPKLTGAANEKAILRVAYSIEEAAASTYLFALGVIRDPKQAGAVATILPVESQHATVLGSMLDMDPGEYLIDFVTTEHALDPADYPAR